MGDLFAPTVPAFGQFSGWAGKELDLALLREHGINSTPDFLRLLRVASTRDRDQLAHWERV